MKKYIYIPVLVILLTAFTTIRAQDRQKEYLGLPGDNLNLYAVMKLFQESETLEGFERSLNDENSRINNLDLNGDGYVDYIRVIDNVDRNVHYIVLQVAINGRENQDVAVFTVIQKGEGRVDIQLIGDEALYGKNYIVEPIIDETPNPGYLGNTGTIDGQRVTVNRTTTIEIAAWPLVRFIFLPTYVVWHSPWYFSYYPSYWRPWNPFSWDYYYGYQYHYYPYYYGHYRHWNEYRYPEYHSYYYGSRRSYSPYVDNRIHEGYYKTTYSHPEQRREGSAMYFKSHPDENTRSSGNSSGGTSVRRSAPENGTGRQSTTTGTNRRSTTTGTYQKSTTTNTERRSTTTGTTRQSDNTGTERKSTTTGTTRQSTTPENNRQSTTSGTVNSGRRSSSVQQATESHSTGKSASTGSSTAGRRSSGSNKAATAGHESHGTKESKTTNGSGRR
jgi:hypothetical protein